MSGRADSPLTKRIDAAVARARKNDIWRSAYMKEREKRGITLLENSLEKVQPPAKNSLKKVRQTP